MILPKTRRDRRAVIASYCKRLSWSQTAVALCEQATLTQEVFLEQVMAAELANREAGRRARLIGANFWISCTNVKDFSLAVAK